MSTSGRRRQLAVRRGFTIIELIIAVVVLGVVGSASAGKIHYMLIHERVTRAASAAQNDVEAAFAIAGRNRQPVRLAWDATKMQLVVTDRAGAVYYRKTALGAGAYGLRAGDVNFSRSPLEIYPNGLANDTLQIAITGTSVTKRVRVSRAGMVRVE